MGTQIVQGRLWSRRAADWAEVQERKAEELYKYALSQVKLSHSKKLLDIGCGAGMFCSMAATTGASITGIDASGSMIDIASDRLTTADFVVGEMEVMPFYDQTFDVVTALNVFQYAGNIQNALREAGRVLKVCGKLVVMIWGEESDCESSTYLNAVGSCMPAPPPSVTGPFALSQDNLLQELMVLNGFKIETCQDIISIWKYNDPQIALRGLLSAGPAVKAIEHCGYEKVKRTLLDSMQHFKQENGQVIYHNKFRVVIASRANPLSQESK